MSNIFSPKNEGFLLVNKSIGPSSFDVIKKCRQATGIKKVGHCGTLDPFASGLLILALGRNFTRHIDQFQALQKTYRLTMVLGAQTDTFDAFGRISERLENCHVDKEKIDSALQSFLGEQEQLPPDFSAKKINGERAYDLARKGQRPELKPVTICIHDIDLISVRVFNYTFVDFRLSCSKGTYVRALVRDLGKALNVPAYTKTLIREKIGDYDIKDAIEVRDFSNDLKSRLFYALPETSNDKTKVTV